MDRPIFFKTIVLKGRDGASIGNIEKTATVGTTDTYTITLTDGETYTFQVTNGTSIANISYTSSSGNVDTYTVTLTDGSTTTFNVTNGEDYTVPTDGVIYFDGDTVPDGYEETSAPSGSGAYATIDDNAVSVSTTYSSSKIEQLISGIGGGGVNYSTTEQDTGLKWIDGRTIYQRTFAEHRDSISTGWNSLSSATWYELYNKIVINHTAIYEKWDEVYSGFLMEFYKDDSQPKFYSPFSLNDSGDFKVTIWYIKTTDTV